MCIRDRKIIMGNPIFKNYCEKPDITQRKLTDYDLNMIVYLQKNLLVSDKTSRSLDSCKSNANSATCSWGLIQKTCLLYTSPSPRDKRQSRMPSSA
eukprot:TRINITY_DN4296_c0_g1_i1.p1 TRINITY_DN4296_c0_g1~~TRINITY_DN4296_c0_g1_i1.p1  ORF type:complete len:104 (-),score=63.64 TRINITY_DN4296_c0_g1_i1:6-293(-)